MKTAKSKGLSNRPTTTQRSKEQSQYLACHDSQTKLPNHIDLFNRFYKLLPQLTPQEITLAVLYNIDFGQVNLLNDTYNHQVND